MASEHPDAAQSRALLSKLTTPATPPPGGMISRPMALADHFSEPERLTFHFQDWRRNNYHADLVLPPDVVRRFMSPGWDKTDCEPVADLLIQLLEALGCLDGRPVEVKVCRVLPDYPAWLRATIEGLGGS